MAFLVFVVNAGAETIDQLNARCVPDATNPHECLNKCIDYLQGVAAKTPGAIVQVTTRDADPSVSTSGTDSTQVSLALN